MFSENVNVRRNWAVTPRGAEESRWEMLYASINRYGDIVISRRTHERCGAPEAYQLLYDRERDVIGLRPARPEKDKHAYPARPRGRHGGRRIRGHRMLREFGVRLAATHVFHECQVDNSGVLILDLRNSRRIGG
jgi:hypothetical protein